MAPVDIEKAFYAGATVQIRSKKDSGYFPTIDEWEDCLSPDWNFGEFDYRVKTKHE